MAGINFAKKGLNQKIFSKKQLRATVGKKSSAFKAVMGNKEVAHVLDKVAERKVLYNAMKQRAAKAGARGFTKNDMKKVLGDVEHSGQFSHKEMHKLGEALIGGAANSRIIREHAADSGGHSNANVEHRSRLNKHNKHRTFDEILGKDRTTRFDSSIGNQTGSASQKVSKVLTFENSNNAIRQAEEKRVSVSQQAKNRVRHLAEDEESDGKEINQTQDRDISLSEEQIKRLQFLQSDQAVKDAQAEEVAVSTEAKKKAKASKEKDEERENELKARAKENYISLSEEQVKRLQFLQSDKAVRDAQAEKVAAEEHVEKKEEEVEDEKKVEPVEQIVGIQEDEEVSLSAEQVRHLEFIQSNEAVREAQSEKVVAKLANDPREGMSTSFGYVPEYLKNFNEGADITKIKSLIAEIQEDKNKDKEDEEDEDDDAKKDDQQKQKYKMAA